MARVVVVGAGVSGLATAARLADFGHDVLICERATMVGGRVGRYARDGFTFDTGPSLLTLPAVYRDLFRKTGRPLERVIELLPADPPLGYQFADGTSLKLPNASRTGIRDALDDVLGPGNGAAWQAVVDHGRQAWHVVRSPFLEAAPTLRDLAGLVVQRRRWRALAPRRSFRSLLQDLAPDPRLRLAVEHTVPGADPRRAPAALSAVPYLIETFGRWRVAGGMGTLVEALHARAGERGVTVHTGRAVTGVLVSSGRATGVRLDDGQPVPADVVVAAVDARQLYGVLLPSAAVARVGARVRRAVTSPSVFTLLLALAGRPPQLPPHTVLLPENTDAELEAVFGTDQFPPQEPTIDIHAPDDPALRPSEDARGWTVHVTVPGHGGVDWSSPALARAYADHVLATMAARGIDVRPYLRWHVIRTPHDLEAATGAPNGAAWGFAIGGPWELLRRPGNRTPVDALFHVGTSAYPGPGLSLVGLSSAIVADLIGRA